MSERSEPCPFCGARIIPIREGEIKRCTVCGGRWFESGGSSTKHRYYPPKDGGTGACILHNLTYEKRRKIIILELF